MIRRIALALALLAAPGLALAAPPEGKGKPEHAGKPDQAGKPPKAHMLEQPVSRDAADIIGRTLLGEMEQRMIRDYFQSVPASSLPPGLARQGKLPVGIVKQLERGKRLPYDVETLPLPDDLLRRLPPYRDARPVVVDDDVVLIQNGTEIVLDILENVL